MKDKKINVGGQAVVEGVMIRGPSAYVVAVRKDKRILTKTASIKKKKHKFLRWPFFRGFANLADMLVIGMKSLLWSAEQAGNEEEKLGKTELFFTLMVSILFVILFFIVLPYFIAHLVGYTEEKRPVMFNVIDGIVRISIFLIYIFIISFMSDVRVLFQYHGAEHKAIHCYEKGKKLSFEHVKKFTTLHPRCGTSFLLIVFIVSVFVFSLLPTTIIFYYPAFTSINFFLRKGILIAIRILLIPLIAGVSYEILKISDKKQGSAFFRLISFPGLLLQKITTKEPTRAQIKVAIASLKKLLATETKNRN